MKEIIKYSQCLKHLPRTGWLRKGIENPESVASHSWQMAIMALVLAGKLAEDEKYDYNKVIKLCLCHDLPECLTGDKTPQDEDYCNKSKKEIDAITRISVASDFPESYLLFTEYEENNTPEAKLAHDLDKIDMYAQALAYEKQYPDKDLKEFKHSAISQIQTELGLKILNTLS